MTKNRSTTKQGSVLSRRLKGIVETRRHIHNPITWLPKKNKAYSIIVTSNDDRLPFITILLQFARLQLRFLLPKLIEPAKTSVYTEVKGFSRKGWVTRYAPKIYGIGYLPKEKVYHIFHGVNSGNQKGFPKDKLKIWIPPWSRYRLVRHLIIDKNNGAFWENTLLKDPKKQKNVPIDILGGVCPKLRFECVNEEACRVIGSAFIEEKERYKGITLFGIQLNRKSKRKQRTLRINLQVNSPDPNGKPHSEQHSFPMLANESMRDAIHRFCKSRVLEKDNRQCLYLEYIEPETK